MPISTPSETVDETMLNTYNCLRLILPLLLLDNKC